MGLCSTDAQRGNVLGNMWDSVKWSIYLIGTCVRCNVVSGE